jgi:hypothetical protein
MVLGTIGSSSIIIVALILGGSYFLYLLFTQPGLAFQVLIGVGNAIFTILKIIFVVITAIVKFFINLFSKKKIR